MDYSVNNNNIVIAMGDDIETIRYIYDVIYAHNGVIEYTKWQCRYNKHVVRTHEPSYTEAYKLVITLKNGLAHNDFILFHLNQQLKNVEHLEKCLTI